MQNNSWLYEGNVFVPPEDFSHKVLMGFVYMITHIPSGKKYIGKKLFWCRRKKKLVESDWKSYYGSNKILQEEIKNASSKDEYLREIIHLCKSKSECNYLEAKEQFATDCLIRSEFYNDWISVRVTRRHMQKFLI